MKSLYLLFLHFVYSNNFCGNLGYPAISQHTGQCLRFFNKTECNILNGNFIKRSGECLKSKGGSYTYDCRYNQENCVITSTNIPRLTRPPQE